MSAREGTGPIDFALVSMVILGAAAILVAALAFLPAVAAEQVSHLAYEEDALPWATRATLSPLSAVLAVAASSVLAAAGGFVRFARRRVGLGRGLLVLGVLPLVAYGGVVAAGLATARTTGVGAGLERCECPAWAESIPPSSCACDARGRLVQERNEDFEARFSYDDEGRVLRMELAGPASRVCTYEPPCFPDDENCRPQCE